VGRFELAERSTIFLDEIGDLEPPLQSKLLRVLQDREYERVGGTTTLTMSARVIAATSRNLRAAVERGEFRSDLYYRLSVVHIRIPALRERLGDIPHLVSSQLGAIATRLGVTAPEATPGFVRRLQEHDWPGNVRELFNTLERVCIERPGRRLEAFHLDGILEGHSSSYVAWSSVVRPASGREVASAPRGEARGTGARGQLDVERLTDILLQTGGNVTRAARRLGIPRGTLRYWIRREGLSHLIPND
jgi:transcriptional regulator with GAF, ATPase, and Fis domain